MKKKMIAGSIIAVVLIAACAMGTGVFKKTKDASKDKKSEQVMSNDVSSAEEETVTYHGKVYKKSELSNQTLAWLALSEEEKLFSSYMPPEFMEFVDVLGITFTVENVTPKGLTLVCTQAGGEPTGELNTGSWYILEEWTKEYGWKEAAWIPQEYEVAWTSEAWMIPMGDSVKWEVNWEWLYGELPAGKYRIGKEIMDFRGPGDYDRMIYYGEFDITE